MSRKYVLQVTKVNDSNVGHIRLENGSEMEKYLSDYVLAIQNYDLQINEQSEIRLTLELFATRKGDLIKNGKESIWF